MSNPRIAIADERRLPDDSPRRRRLDEGDRYEVAELLDGRYQVTIDHGDYVVQHAGAADSVRTRAEIDGDTRDRAAIAAALPPRAGGAQPGGGR